MSCERLMIGAMSGTSADGVDVALVAVNGRRMDRSAKLIRHHHRPYDPTVRKAIFATRSDRAVALRDLAELARSVTLTYAAAVNELLSACSIDAATVAAVSAHGQTLFHDPPRTIQWLDPSLLAYETGCCVVSDLRRADCAAGGQGAPLVPFADYILFRHPEKTRVLLNIGGIANLTFLPAGATLERIIAFDTGPGNCISDWLCRTYLDTTYDAEGRLAGSGTAHFALAFAAARNAYTFLRPPKSTDAPTMIDIFQRLIQDPLPVGSATPDAATPCHPERYSAKDLLSMTRQDPSPSTAQNDSSPRRCAELLLRPKDLLATACLATAMSIRLSFDLFLQNWRQHGVEVIVSGGGVANRAMMQELSKALTGDGFQVRIVPLADLGVPPQAKEAVAFALLGAATLDGEPANVPAATGARRAVVLGSITPRP